MESSFNITLPESPVRDRLATTPRPRCLRHRAPVLWLLLPLMGGLVIGRVVPGLPAPGWLFGPAILALVLALIFSTRPLIWTTGLVLGLLFAGAGYYELRRARLGVWDNLPLREAHLTLHIERTFAPSADGKRISGFARITQTDAHLQDLNGQRLYFSLARRPGETTPIRSAEIAVVGLLQTLPHGAPAGSFDGYLTNLGLNFRLNRGRVLAQTALPTAYRKFCDNARDHLASLLSLGLEKHPDLAAISRAMLLGLQQELSEEQSQWFMRSGTMHLFSISGLHIAVIALALEGLLLLLRLPRVARFLSSAVLLWLYVDITGTAPSAVRAYIMVMLMQASYVFRLPVNAVATLGFAAFGALLIDPMQLFTASFQMSYGIVASLLLLGLPLGEFWSERWQLYRLLPKATWTWWQRTLDLVQRWLLSVAAIGLSTALVSTVSGIIYFGLFTPGSLLANLVLIPVGSLAILSGFISMLNGLAGLGTLCSLFNHASALVLLGCEHGIDYFLKVPGMFRPAQFVSGGTGFLSLGLLLTTLFWGYATRWENKRGGLWPPFAITAIALVFGVKFG